MSWNNFISKHNKNDLTLSVLSAFTSCETIELPFNRNTCRVLYQMLTSAALLVSHHLSFIFPQCVCMSVCVSCGHQCHCWCVDIQKPPQNCENVCVCVSDREKHIKPTLSSLFSLRQKAVPTCARCYHSRLSLHVGAERKREKKSNKREGAQQHSLPWNKHKDRAQRSHDILSSVDNSQFCCTC